MTKTIMIEFADPRLRACDHYDDIIDAYFLVNGRLKSRHNIDVGPPHIINKRVFMEVVFENGEECNVSRNLGEIGRVLAKSEFYKRYMVGSRLLYYYDATDFEVDGHL